MPSFDLTPDEVDIIQRLRAEAEEAAPPWQPRALSDIPTEDKVKAFDELYRQALEYFTETVSTKYFPKDGDTYIFEAVMELTLGKDVWGPMNAATG